MDRSMEGLAEVLFTELERVQGLKPDELETELDRTKATLAVSDRLIKIAEVTTKAAEYDLNVYESGISTRLLVGGPRDVSNAKR